MLLWRRKPDQLRQPFTLMQVSSHRILTKAFRRALIGAMITSCMLSSYIPDFEAEMARIQEIAPSGFVLVFGFRYTGPDYVYSTYPDEWIEIYQNRRYYSVDPVFLWGLSQSGVRRWSKTGLPDVRGVMKHALQFGLRYGAIMTQKTDLCLSFLSAARADRELTDTEIAILESKFSAWHHLVMSKPRLTTKELDVLRGLRDGFGQRDIADKLGIAESTVKQRAVSACTKLNAKNRTHAVAIAVERQYFTG